MARMFLTFLLFILISDTGLAQINLDIEIIEIRNNTGKIMFQLFDENKNVIFRQIAEIKESKCSLSITSLKPGKYAVRYYHDENQNRYMETNLVGKPLEGYGYSNNVTGKLGPPLFEKWLFDLSEDKKLILKPTY